MVETQNRGWGFYGEFVDAGIADEAWAAAVAALVPRSGFSEDEVAEFLDSRFGRQFADDVRNGLARGLTIAAAVEAAAERWAAWRLSERAARSLGVPREVRSYLVAMVGLACVGGAEPFCA